MFECEEVLVDEAGKEVVTVEMGRDSMSMSGMSGDDTDIYGDNDSDYEYDMYDELD
jgi:hypothetical protein